MNNNTNVPYPPYEKYRGLRSLLITRVSTPGQSHDAQERVIREKLIEPLGLVVDEERHVIHDTYTGLEYRYREALDKILQMAERREFDVLCLDILDRGLGRKGVSREVFRGQLRELGIHILSTEPSDHSDDDSLEGQLMRLLKGYKAEEEVNDFVRRSKNAIRHKALGDPEKGIPSKIIGNGFRPYGYKFVCDAKGKREALELNYDVIWVDRKGVEWTEVRVVLFVFRCAKRRIPTGRICRRLGDIGIPAPCITLKRKPKKLDEEKAQWLIPVVSKLLRNTCYSGKAVVNGYQCLKVPGKKSSRRIKRPLEEHITVNVPAIVSEEFQGEVLRNLQRNQKFSIRNNKQRTLTLLRGGYAKCGNCGRNVSTKIATYQGLDGLHEYTLYRCNGLKRGISHRCIGCSTINVKTVDDAAWQKILEIIHNPSMIDAAIEQKKSGDPTASRRKQINKNLKAIKDERTALQTTLLRMIREHALDKNTEGVLTSRLKELEKLEHEYNSELLDDEKIHQQWEKVRKSLEKMHKRCADMCKKLENPSYEPSYAEKRELVEFLGITAIIWETGHSPRFKLEVNPPEIVSSHPLT